jgi:hypothetical protein
MVKNIKPRDHESKREIIKLFELHALVVESKKPREHENTREI